MTPVSKCLPVNDRVLHEKDVVANNAGEIFVKGRSLFIF
jgi:hypothetical protein